MDLSRLWIFKVDLNLHLNIAFIITFNFHATIEHISVVTECGHDTKLTFDRALLLNSSLKFGTGLAF